MMKKTPGDLLSEGGGMMPEACYMESGVFRERYDRNFDTLSKREQQTLAGSTVAVVGLGGLGGGVVEMLSRVGVGSLILLDGDVFEASNLNRQLFSREDLIGTPKAEAAKERVAAINSEINVSHRVVYVDDENLCDLLKGADVVMDCLDAIDTRFVLQTAAGQAGIPIVSGAIAGVTGQVTTIFPKDPGYSLIYGERNRSRSKGVELKTGNISYCALLVSALQASECVKVLLNRGDVLQNKLLIAELWHNRFEIVRLTR